MGLWVLSLLLRPQPGKRVSKMGRLWAGGCEQSPQPPRHSPGPRTGRGVARKTGPGGPRGHCRSGLQRVAVRVRQVCRQRGAQAGWGARPQVCSGPGQGSPTGGPRLRPAALPTLCSLTRSWDQVSSSASTSQSPAAPRPQSPLAVPPSQRSRVGAGTPASPMLSAWVGPQAPLWWSGQPTLLSVLVIYLKNETLLLFCLSI